MLVDLVFTSDQPTIQLLVDRPDNDGAHRPFDTNPHRRMYQRAWHDWSENEGVSLNSSQVDQKK